MGPIVRFNASLTQLTDADDKPSRLRARARVSSQRHNQSVLSDDGLNRPGAVLLALDLGTTTGWAITTQDGPITSGTESFRPHRFEGGGMRFLRFKRWLTELKASVEALDAVYFEEVRRHVGVDAAHAYGGFLAHLTAWCEHHQIPYQGVPVGTIKKHATGKGNADKAALMAAVRSKGFRPADDNEADAIALLLWALNGQEN